MSDQITDTIMMVRPVAFYRNPETAVNNLFQPREEIMDEDSSQDQALIEFDQMVSTLRSYGINIIVFQDNEETSTPDSIFPNNWNSFHDNGTVYLYPMFAENRRRERRQDILNKLSEEYSISSVKSFVHFEDRGKYLEGTGSLILDRSNKIAYAAIAERTHPEVLEEFAKETGFKMVSFTANQTFEGKRYPIYHTNVMMCLGESFVLICSACIDNPTEREYVLDTLFNSGKEIIHISEEQRDQFAGNMLQVRNNKGDRFIVMSDSAYKSLHPDQISALEDHGKLIHVPLDTIEKLGGGSARCMMAEVFLPKK